MSQPSDLNRVDLQPMQLDTIPGVEARARFLGILQRLNQISQAPEMSALLEGMLDLMAQVTGADAANYFHLDADEDEFVFTIVRGDLDSQYLIGLRLKRRQVLPDISSDSALPVVIGDLPAEPNWLATVDPSSAALKRNMISLPVALKDQLLGIVQIFNYTQVELDLLLTLANQLAVELDHRLQIESAQNSNHHLMTLVDVLGEVAGTLDRNRLLHLVTENAARLVDAERSSIFLVDPDTNEMVYQVAYRSDEVDASQRPLPRPAGLPLRQIKASAPAQAANKIALPQEHDFSFFSRSAITVPLRAEPLSENQSVQRRSVIGGLMALNHSAGTFRQEDAHLLSILADQASTYLEMAEIHEGAGELFMGVIKALVAAIDAKDPYTQGHSQRVSEYSVLLSQELGLDEAAVYDIKIGSLLHDIGKIGIPDPILLKVSKMTSEEFQLIKRHPVTGMNILSQVKMLEPMIPAIAEHHERLDGSGYPNHLIGSQISLMGRIVAVADVFDAMTSDRPYRPALHVSQVLAHLRENAGKLFDPRCVEALESILSGSAIMDEG